MRLGGAEMGFLGGFLRVRHYPLSLMASGVGAFFYRGGGQGPLAPAPKSATDLSWKPSPPLGISKMFINMILAHECPGFVKSVGHIRHV